jgi:hypothetical protein
MASAEAAWLLTPFTIKNRVLRALRDAFGYGVGKLEDLLANRPRTFEGLAILPVVARHGSGL